MLRYCIIYWFVKFVFGSFVLRGRPQTTCRWKMLCSQGLGLESQALGKWPVA